MDIQPTQAKCVEMDKNIAEHVQILSHKVKNLERILNNMCSQLKEERLARCILQSVIKNHLITNSKELETIEWPATEFNSVS